MCCGGRWRNGSTTEMLSCKEGGMDNNMAHCTYVYLEHLTFKDNPEFDQF